MTPGGIPLSSRSVSSERREILPIAAQPEGWAARFGPGLLIVAVAVAAYANSLAVPFVYDDLLAIPQNPSIRGFWPLTRVLFPAVDGGVTVSGRPVLNLSLALNHAAGGTGVGVYHVTNLLIHAAAGLLLCGLVRRTLARFASAAPRALSDRGLALLIAAAWTAHPLSTQAVTYTVQRAESLMGLWLLLTLYGFVRSTAGCNLSSDTAGARGWRALSVAACALGMGTKEVMAVAPLLVLLYDRAFVAGSFAAAWRARRSYYLALAGTWLVLAALLAATGGNRGGTVGLGTGVALWAYPLTQFQAIATYLARSAWPEPLVFEYGTFWVRAAGEVAPFAAIVLPLLAATVVALRRWPAAGFAGAWFFLILAPSSLAPGTIQMIVEHRMYLPLAAVVAMTGWALTRAVGRHVIVAGVAVSAALLLLTVRRNHDYRSPFALWSDTIAKRPENPRAWEGLAEALEGTGRWTEAIRPRREAVRRQPDAPHAHYNLALTLAGAGQTDEAVRVYRGTLELDPTEARAHTNLAILLAQQGHTEEALRHHATAVQLRPNEALYHFNRGVALRRIERLEEASASFESALRFNPSQAEGHFHLAAIRVKQRRLADAAQHYEAGLRPAPNHAEARTRLANLLLDLERPADALRHFEVALKLAPGDAAAHHNLGIAFAQLERWDEARRAFDEALRLKPDYADARRSREQLRQVTGR